MGAVERRTPPRPQLFLQTPKKKNKKKTTTTKPPSSKCFPFSKQQRPDNLGRNPSGCGESRAILRRPSCSVLESFRNRCGIVAESSDFRWGRAFTSEATAGRLRRRFDE